MTVDNTKRRVPTAYGVLSILYANGGGLVFWMGLSLCIKYFSGMYYKPILGPIIFMIIGGCFMVYIRLKNRSLETYQLGVTKSIEYIGHGKHGYSLVKYEDMRGREFEKKCGGNHSSHHPDPILFDPDEPQKMHLSASFIFLKIKRDGSLEDTIWCYVALVFVFVYMVSIFVF